MEGSRPNSIEWHVGQRHSGQSFLVITDGAWKRIKVKHPECCGAVVGWVISKGRTQLAQQGRPICASSPTQAEGFAFLYPPREVEVLVWTDSTSIVKFLQCKIINTSCKQTLIFTG